MSEATARELDRQVAEALGWCAFRWEEGRLYGLPPGNPPPGRHYVHDYAVPLYSSEIGAAWEVVRWLDERDWGYAVRNIEKGEHRAYFAWRKGTCRSVERTGRSTEEAICLAFLACLKENPELRGERAEGGEA
jgi:hypothetical protein